MADDAATDSILVMIRKCAEAVGREVVLHIADGHDNALVLANTACASRYDCDVYNPSTDPAQAFELLCWLAERGTVTVALPYKHLRFEAGEHDFKEACTTPAELRLAIMRAVAKVKEDQDGR